MAAAGSAVPPYSGPLKTRRVEPWQHSNYQSEWRIADPAETVLTNLRLVNVGCVAGGNASVHHTIGLLSLIRHVRLEANGREVDSQRFYNRLACFREGLQDTNDEQVSVQRNLTCSKNGFAINNREDAINDYDFAMFKFLTQDGPNAAQVTANVATTPTAVVELRNVLGFLRAAPLLHPSAMGELRLIIEWETALGAGLPNDIPVTILPPQLVMTYSRDPAMAEEAVRSLGRPITFSTWFHDQFYAEPPADVDVFNNDDAVANFERPQVVPVRPRAFDGHYVQRMLQMNEPGRFVNALCEYKGLLQSGARYKGNDIVIINGLPEFGAYGIDTPARRATILHDAFEGSHTHLPGSEIIGTRDNGSYTDNGTGPLLGTEEWTGYVVGKHIASLQLQWGRSVVKLRGQDLGSTRVNQAFTVRLFGEVYRTRLANGTVVALATQ